jgi:hypothetical protein
MPSIEFNNNFNTIPNISEIFGLLNSFDNWTAIRLIEVEIDELTKFLPPVQLAAFSLICIPR